MGKRQEITPIGINHDFYVNKTALQNSAWDDDLWRTKYAGQPIRWSGDVSSIERNGDSISVKVSVDYDCYDIGDETRWHAMLVKFAVPMSQQDYYLSFAEREHVDIEGILPAKRQYIHDFNIVEGKLSKPKKASGCLTIILASTLCIVAIIAFV